MADQMIMQDAAPPLDVGPIEDAPSFKFKLILYKILERQDRVRSITTITFVAVFGLTVLLSFLAIFLGTNWTNTKDLIQLLLPAETALLGSALGFYFGSRNTTSGNS